MPAVTLLAGVAAIAARPIPNEPSRPTDDPPSKRLDRLLDRASRHLTQASIHSCIDHRTRSLYRILSERSQSIEGQAEAVLGRFPVVTISMSTCTTLHDHRKFSFHAARVDYFLRRAERMIRRGETD